MYMAEGRWNEAYNEFYEGFRGYQEAGNPRAKDALKYVVLANMLSLSDINPFAAREAIAFQEEKEIVAMRSLRTAYEANDLASFERTLMDKANRILEDPFIMTYDRGEGPATRPGIAFWGRRGGGGEGGVLRFVSAVRLTVRVMGSLRPATWLHCADECENRSF